MRNFSQIKLVKAAPGAAFTLIELMMVMLIMAIVMAVAVPAFGPMGRGADMRGAVSSVRNTLSQSRQWAITHREAVTFCYQSFSNFYVTNSVGPITPTESLPRSVRFGDSGAGTVTFKADGSLASGAATVTVVLLNSNVVKNIRVNGLTGGIAVE